MRSRLRAVLRRGIESAMVASIPQVLVPKVEEWLFLREDESADLGPRFIDALARRVDRELPEDVRWLGASAFHFGYAAFWGALYALANERWRMRPWVGGQMLAAVIYLITFPSWGGAVLSGSEPAPRERTWRLEVMYATAPLIFGLVTAWLYGRGPEACEDQ